MRTDARENREHILNAARAVVAERGVNASLRDVARRAEVGLATLFRHFPTRENLLEALLRTSLDELTDRATFLEQSASPDAAVVSWLHDAVAFVSTYGGIVAMMANALADTKSALHVSCERLRAAGARLLGRAQEEGTARLDLDGDDFFALIGALGWIGDQPALAPRATRLTDLIAGAILGT